MRDPLVFCRWCNTLVVNEWCECPMSTDQRQKIKTELDSRKRREESAKVALEKLGCSEEVLLRIKNNGQFTDLIMEKLLNWITETYL